jgi:hypothetical protein
MNMALLAAVLLAGAGPAAAQNWQSGAQDGKYPAGYWQVNYGLPQYGNNYNVMIEASDMAAAEEAVKKLAAEYGATAQQRGGESYYQAGQGRPQSRALSFYATEPNGEAFAQKLSKVGRLKQYYMNSILASGTYAEVKKKAALLKGEIDANRGALEKQPIASSIMNDLLDRCNSYLQAFDAAKDKAYIAVTLTEKRPADQKTAGGQ